MHAFSQALCKNKQFLDSVEPWSSQDCRLHRSYNPLRIGVNWSHDVGCCRLGPPAGLNAKVEH